MSESSEFDEGGRLTRKVGDDGTEYVYQYDSKGRLARETVFVVKKGRRRLMKTEKIYEYDASWGLPEDTYTLINREYNDNGEVNDDEFQPM